MAQQLGMREVLEKQIKMLDSMVEGRVEILGDSKQLLTAKVDDICKLETILLQIVVVANQM